MRSRAAESSGGAGPNRSESGPQTSSRERRRQLFTRWSTSQRTVRRRRASPWRKRGR